ncbi:hypothetical protein M405DRAFT_870500 [Rhizopogon salebrosus TDB-379]|nr:hypothetical protein M405DRAFT_870500 [Rhizopogon salebrosus TDB-379]
MSQNYQQELLPEGTAVAPVIIAIDKMQLTQFSGSKSVYPVYLTLGNIPRAIRDLDLSLGLVLSICLELLERPKDV